MHRGYATFGRLVCYARRRYRAVALPLARCRAYFARYYTRAAGSPSPFVYGCPYFTDRPLVLPYAAFTTPDLVWFVGSYTFTVVPQRTACALWFALLPTFVAARAQLPLPRLLLPVWLLPSRFTRYIGPPLYCRGLRFRTHTAFCTRARNATRLWVTVLAQRLQFTRVGLVLPLHLPGSCTRCYGFTFNCPWLPQFPFTWVWFATAATPAWFLRCLHYAPHGWVLQFCPLPLATLPATAVRAVGPHTWFTHAHTPLRLLRFFTAGSTHCLVYGLYRLVWFNSGLFTVYHYALPLPTLLPRLPFPLPAFCTLYTDTTHCHYSSAFGLVLHRALGSLACSCPHTRFFTFIGLYAYVTFHPYHGFWLDCMPYTTHSFGLPCTFYSSVGWLVLYCGSWLPHPLPFYLLRFLRTFGSYLPGSAAYVLAYLVVHLVIPLYGSFMVLTFVGSIRFIHIQFTHTRFFIPVWFLPPPAFFTHGPYATYYRLPHACFLFYFTRYWFCMYYIHWFVHTRLALYIYHSLRFTCTYYCWTFYATFNTAYTGYLAFTFAHAIATRTYWLLPRIPHAHRIYLVYLLRACTHCNYWVGIFLPYIASTRLRHCLAPPSRILDGLPLVGFYCAGSGSHLD